MLVLLAKTVRASRAAILRGRAAATLQTSVVSQYASANIARHDREGRRYFLHGRAA